MKFNAEIERTLSSRNGAMAACQLMENLRRLDHSNAIFLSEDDYWKQRHDAHREFVAARNAHHSALVRSGLGFYLAD
jgi:hypothetical protein